MATTIPTAPASISLTPMTPQPTFGIPQSAYGTSSAQYGQVSPTGQVQLTPQQLAASFAPSPQIQPVFNVPQSAYGTSSASPTSQTGAVQQYQAIFGTPQSAYGTSSAQYGQVSQSGQTELTPQQMLSAYLPSIQAQPQTIFGIPQSVYGTSSAQYGQVSPTGQQLQMSMKTDPASIVRSDFFGGMMKPSITPNLMETISTGTFNKPIGSDYVYQPLKEQTRDEAYIKNTELTINEYNNQLQTLLSDPLTSKNGLKSLDAMKESLISDLDTRPGVQKTITNGAITGYDVPTNFPITKEFNLMNPDGSSILVRFEPKLNTALIEGQPAPGSFSLPYVIGEFIFGGAKTEGRTSKIEASPIEVNKGLGEVPGQKIYSGMVPMYGTSEGAITSKMSLSGAALADLQLKPQLINEAVSKLKIDNDQYTLSVNKLETSPEFTATQQAQSNLNTTIAGYGKLGQMSSKDYFGFDEKGNLMSIGPGIKPEDQQVITQSIQTIQQNYPILQPQIQKLQNTEADLTNRGVALARYSEKYEEAMLALQRGQKNIAELSPIKQLKDVIQENLRSDKPTAIVQTILSGKPVTSTSPILTKLGYLGSELGLGMGYETLAAIPEFVSSTGAYGSRAVESGDIIGAIISPITAAYKDPLALTGALELGTMGLSAYLTGPVMGANIMASNAAKTSILGTATKIVAPSMALGVGQSALNYFMTPIGQRSIWSSLGTGAEATGLGLGITGIGIGSASIAREVRAQMLANEVQAGVKEQYAKMFGTQKAGVMSENVLPGGKSSATQRIGGNMIIDTSQYGRVNVDYKGIITKTFDPNTGKLIAYGPFVEKFRLLDYNGNPITSFKDLAKTYLAEKQNVGLKSGDFDTYARLNQPQVLYPTSVSGYPLDYQPISTNGINYATAFKEEVPGGALSVTPVGEKGLPTYNYDQIIGLRGQVEVPGSKVTPGINIVELIEEPNYIKYGFRTGTSTESLPVVKTQGAGVYTTEFSSGKSIVTPVKTGMEFFTEPVDQERNLLQAQSTTQIGKSFMTTGKIGPVNPETIDIEEALGTRINPVSNMYMRQSVITEEGIPRIDLTTAGEKTIPAKATPVYTRFTGYHATPFEEDMNFIQDLAGKNLPYPKTAGEPLPGAGTGYDLARLALGKKANLLAVGSSTAADANYFRTLVEGGTQPGISSFDLMPGEIRVTPAAAAVKNILTTSPFLPPPGQLPIGKIVSPIVSGSSVYDTGISSMFGIGAQVGVSSGLASVSKVGLSSISSLTPATSIASINDIIGVSKLASGTSLMTELIPISITTPAEITGTRSLSLVEPDVTTTTRSLSLMESATLPEIAMPTLTTTTLITPNIPTVPVLPLIVPVLPPVVPLSIPQLSSGELPIRRGGRFIGKKIKSPIANWEIFFKKQFGYYGLPGVRRTINVYKPSFGDTTDVGNFQAKLKYLI